MTLTRRSTLTLAGGAVAAGVIGYLGRRQLPRAGLTGRPSQTARRRPEDQRKTERTLGDPAAKVTVHEFFSLTCTHCAAFARGTMPQVEKDLIAPASCASCFTTFRSTRWR